jgi:2-polyprenyl-3-methyl-5-hydroxy-6-metoxy-1,4-benzoquinol methylase
MNNKEFFLLALNLSYKVESLANEVNINNESSKKSFCESLTGFKDVMKSKVSELGDDFAEFNLSFDSVIKSIENNENFNAKFEKCISLIKNYIAFKLAPILYNEDVKLNKDEFEQVMAFYMKEDFNVQLKALGILCTALTQKVLQPDKCYIYAIEAFKIFPELASKFSSKYVYDESRIADKIFENCPICGAYEAKPHYCTPQFEYVGENNTFSPVKLWVKCDKCKNLYSYNFPVINMGDINGKYTRNFNDDYIKPRYSLRVYSEIFNKCKNITQGNEYLEIGIGGGEMLAAAMEMGYNVDAVEICREDCEKVASVLGIDIKWCDFLKFETTKKYDVIIMGDVLEHISEPVRALEKAKQLLNEDAVLWLSTPNYNSGFSRLMKFKDAMWNQKNHFTYFSYETLLPILHQVGLDVARYDISERYNGSMELYCVNKK